VVNGNGRVAAGANRRLDDNLPKNFMGHLTRDLASGVGVRKYETLTGGGGYQLQRNFRVYGELTRDLEARTLLWTLGLTTAF
jgi:hypothetical protein